MEICTLSLYHSAVIHIHSTIQSGTLHLFFFSLSLSRSSSLTHTLSTLAHSFNSIHSIYFCFIFRLLTFFLYFFFFVLKWLLITYTKWSKNLGYSKMITCVQTWNGRCGWSKMGRHREEACRNWKECIWCWYYFEEFYFNKNEIVDWFACTWIIIYVEEIQLYLSILDLFYSEIYSVEFKNQTKSRIVLCDCVVYLVARRI